MVRGKPSNQSARQVDFTPLSLRDRKLIYDESFLYVKQRLRVMDVDCSLYSGRVALIHEAEWEANGCWSDSTVLQACVLGLPCKDWNSIRTVPPLTDIETA